MTDAALGYGSLLEVSTDGGDNWVPLAEVIDITPPADTIDTVDATHMQSPNRTREYIEGLADGGEFSFEMNFVPGSATDLKIQSLKSLGAVDWRLTFPNSVIWEFSGIRTTYEPAAPNEDKMTATVGVKVTGAYTPSAAAAPANEILPAISGIAQVGQVLTAWPGQWSGAPAFTYQWETDDGGGYDPISGATGAQYTVLIGDLGNPIHVVVTATNSAGNDSETSAPTADVIAA